MSSLMTQFGGKDGKFCVSPDNARIPPIYRHESPDPSSRNSTSSHSSTRMQLLSSPRIRPSRWSNASPAAAALQAAVLVADSGVDCSIGEQDAKRRMDVLPSSLTHPNLNCIDGSTRTRTCPKDLLESSMGGSSCSFSRRSCQCATSPESSSSLPRPVNDDRWTGKSTNDKCTPPSPPCRRRGSKYSLRKHIETGDDEDGGLESTESPRRRRSRTSPGIDDDEISNATIHTKNIKVLSPKTYEYEKRRINDLMRCLPDSLRAPPY
jgi:hypothetical protein